MRRSTIALISASPLLTLTACGGATDDTQDPSDLPTVAADAPADETGVTEDELATNALLSALGVNARKLSNETPFEEDRTIVAEMRDMVEKDGGALPAALRANVADDLKSIEAAIGAGDQSAKQAAATALIERLRSSAPAGGGRAPDVAM